MGENKWNLEAERKERSISEEWKELKEGWKLTGAEVDEGGGGV